MPARGVIEGYWCLCTKVKNVSGQCMHFSFLPPHGVTLAADEAKYFPGNLVATLPAMSGRHWARRDADAFARAWSGSNALGTPLIELRHTTGKFVEDLCTGETYIIESQEGQPVSVLPCNEQSSYDCSPSPAPERQ